MDTLIPELRGEILNQADPDVILNLALTNRAFAKEITEPKGLKILEARFGWVINDYQDFIDLYYTTYLTDKCVNYFDPYYCLGWALKENNLIIADKIFEYLRFNDPDFTKNCNVDRIIRAALEAESGEPYEYVQKKFRPYNLIERIYEDDVVAAIRSGNIERLDMVLSGKFQGASANRDTFIEEAILTDNIGMFDRVIFGFPTYINGLDDLMGNTEFSRNNVYTHKELHEFYSIAYTLGSNRIVEYLSTINNFQDLDITEIPLNSKAYKEYPQKVVDIINQKIKGGINRYTFDKFVGMIEQSSHKDLDILEAFYDFLDDHHIQLNLKRLRQDVGDISLALIFDFISMGHHGMIFANYILKRTILKPSDLDYFYKNNQEYHISKDPIVLKWFRKRGKNKELYKLDFTRDGFDKLIVNYRVDPAANNNEAIILACATNSTMSIKELLKHYQVDPSAQNNKCIKAVVSTGNLWSFTELLNDPRVNPQDVQISPKKIGASIDIKNRLESDYRVNLQKKPERLIEIHTLKRLSYEERYELMKHLHLAKNPKFRHYYLMSDDQLAKELNKFQVPWIPHLNHLAATIFLSTPGADRHVRAENIAPISTSYWMQAAIYYMKEKDTYDKMLLGA